MGLGDLRLQLLDVHGMYGRCAGEAHVNFVVGKGVQIGGLCGLADCDETAEG